MQIDASCLNHALAEPKVGVMNFLNEIAMRYPDAISFAPGRPREEYFDVAASLEHVAAYASHIENARAGGQGAYGALGQYGRTNGMIGALIAEMLRKDDRVEVAAADVVVTVGCQEAMCLALLALCGNRGDVALVADPAYIGLSGAARLLGIELAGVACGPDGIDLDALEDTVGRLMANGRRPGLLYLSPDAANPTGATMPAGARARLLELTRRRGIVVLEDHAYNYFQYDDGEPAALKSLPESDHVIYLGSFSKSVYPGLRLGFLATTLKVRSADGAMVHVAEELSKIKSMLTVNTSPLCQAIAGGLLLRHDCSLKAYTAARRAQVRESRDAMLAALERAFPAAGDWCAGVSWNRPAGGFFLCLTLPFTVTENDLLCSAQEYGVLWTPMSYFYLERAASEEIRLSFSYVTPAQAEAGIAALARWVRARVAADVPERETRKAACVG